MQEILCPMCLKRFTASDSFQRFVVDPRGVKRATCMKCFQTPEYASQHTTDEALSMRQRVKKTQLEYYTELDDGEYESRGVDGACVA